MANTLTGLYQTVYAALNVVSRELIGFIPAVSKDPRAEQVTLNQPIRSPVVPAMTASDIAPSNTSSTGADRNVSYVDMNITKQRKVSFHLTGEETKGLQAANVGPDIAKQSFAQAFRTLANEIETDLAGLYVDASRAYGTAGTTPFGTANDLTDATNAMKLLDDNGAPRAGRALILNTAAVANLLGKQPAVFRVNEAGQEMSRKFGQLETLYGFTFGTSAQLKEHDASGTITGVMIDNSAGEAVGATDLTVDGGGAGEILNAGDIVTLAGDTEKYVAQTMAASATTLSINAPGLREAAADDAAITAVGDYTPNVAFTRDAFHLVCRVPAVPDGGDAADDRMHVMDEASRLVFEVAVYRQYRQVTYEVGICWGVKTVKPEHSVILLG